MESSRRDLCNGMAEHTPILKNNQNTHCSLIFQDRPIFSHINQKSKALAETFAMMAESRPIVKNNQNTHLPRFGFTLKTKTGRAFPRKGFLFLL